MPIEGNKLQRKHINNLIRPPMRRKLERKVKHMEFNENQNEPSENEIEESQSESGKVKQWFQDNLRIIVSVLIVVAIAGGIYSYSKRTEAPQTEPIEESTVLGEITGEEITGAEEERGVSANIPPESEEKKEKTETAPPAIQNKTSSIATSQETENSFVETAIKGDGTTRMARHALANYLEKNPDSSLTAEHKIYIEDYLRKHIPQKGRVLVGTSIEFSKGAIADAISKSKNLNDNQLKNLHKYAVRVPSLS